MFTDNLFNTSYRQEELIKEAENFRLLKILDENNSALTGLILRLLTLMIHP